MGRPKADERSAPEKMQEAFWTLLEQKPYAQITISDITRESGLNRSAFYYHYANIPELADDAIAAIYEEPGVAAFIAHVIRQDGDLDDLREFALAFISTPEHRVSLHRLSLIAGPHGSTGLASQLKNYVIGIWLAALGLDAERLNPGQRIVLEYASSGMLGILGKARTLLTPETIDWLAYSTVPDTISRLINSLKPGAGDSAYGHDAQSPPAKAGDSAVAAREYRHDAQSLPE